MDEERERVRQTYGDAKHERLVTLKIASIPRTSFTGTRTSHLPSRVRPIWRDSAGLLPVAYTCDMIYLIVSFMGQPSTG